MSGEPEYEATSPASSPGSASSGTPSHEAKRQRGEESPTPSMLQFSHLIGHVDAAKIFSDLEKDPRLQLKIGNRRQRRTAAQVISKGVVAELYSPPRVAKTAERLGLAPGLSLDLTTKKNDLAAAVVVDDEVGSLA